MYQFFFGLSFKTYLKKLSEDFLKENIHERQRENKGKRVKKQRKNEKWKKK